MTDEQFKPSAKCVFYNQCAIYNSGILKDEVENELCGKGQAYQSDYIPRIHKTYSPETIDSLMPAIGAVCPSYSSKIESTILSKIRSALEQNDFFWQKKITIDEIVKK